MYLPSVEAVKITIDLLRKFKDVDSFEEALMSKYDVLTPEKFLQEKLDNVNNATMFYIYISICIKLHKVNE